MSTEAEEDVVVGHSAAVWFTKLISFSGSQSAEMQSLSSS